MLNTNKVVNKMLGNKPKKDKRSKNKTQISNKLMNLIREYPNDYIVISDRFGSDFKISEPYTYRQDAVEEYNSRINNLPINWKTNIYQLNKNSLSRFL